MGRAGFWREWLEFPYRLAASQRVVPAIWGRNAEAAQVQGVHGQAGGGEGGCELGEDGGAIGKSVDKKQSGRAGGIQANGLGAAARGVRGVGAAGDAARVEGIGD